MRSLILALAVAAMVASSGCCLNDSSCNSCDGCPGGLAGRSSGCQLGNCRFFGGGGENLGLGIFEKGSECSSCDGGGCSSGGCSSGECSSGGSSNVAGRVASNVRDRRATRRSATQRAATQRAATRKSVARNSVARNSGACNSGACNSVPSNSVPSNSVASNAVASNAVASNAVASNAVPSNAVPSNAVSRNSATAIPAPVGMVEGPIMVDGPKTGGCGLESCGLGGQGCGQGCGLGNRLPGNALAAGARAESGRARHVGRVGGCGSASCGLGGPGCGQGCALRNYLPGALQNHPYGGQIPHSNPALGPQGGAGGLTPTYQYPYYTTRGPRDFLNGNPPSIGPR